MHIRPTWLLLLPSLLCSCGNTDPVWAGDDLRVAGSIIRLQLEGTNPDYAVGEITPYLTNEIPPGDLPRGWQVHPKAAASPYVEKRKAFGAPWQGLRFTTKGRLSIPGAFEASRFNRAAVTLALKSKADLQVELFRDGKRLLQSAVVRVEGDNRPKVAIIDLPGTLGLKGECDRLRLHVTPQGGKPTILGVDLLMTPIASWLPTAEQGLGPVALNGEARHAVGLSSQNPLRATHAVPPDAQLRFSYSLPSSVNRADDTLAIRVQVTAPDGSPVGGERIPITKVDRWQEASVDLEHQGGDDLTIRFSLEGAASEAETLVALASPRFERKLKNPPAVLLVTSDTHRADHLGKDGKVSTPFLDRLADQGMLFEDCLAATNITNPSHASILTGLSARDTGLNDNITALSDEALTLGECFQSAGFYTIASLSAKHMNHGQSGLGQGFDQVAFPSTKGSIDSPTAIAPIEKWLDEAEHKPIFAWLHVFDAHAPYEVPDSHQWLYYDRDKDPYDPDLPALEGRARVGWDPELRDAAYLVAQYRSEVTFLDEQLARGLAHPRLQDAVIAVTSDHGEHFGSHGLYWTHQGLYPETLAVPLILSWPDGPTGLRVESPVNQLDLGRTLLDVAGLTWVEFPGENLLRWVEDPTAEEEPRFAIGSHAIAASIHHEGWFLVLNLRTHGSPPRSAHQVELYRPGDDPECAVDLVDDEFETAKRLRALLVEWLQDAPTKDLARKAGVSDPQVLAELAALGYATDVQTEAHGEVLFTSDPKGNKWDRRFDG